MSLCKYFLIHIDEVLSIMFHNKVILCNGNLDKIVYLFNH